MSETEIDYLRRRAAEERDRADLARDPTVAHVHRQLANGYANKVADLGELTDREAIEQRDMPQPAASRPTL